MPLEWAPLATPCARLRASSPSGRSEPSGQAAGRAHPSGTPALRKEFEEVRGVLVAIAKTPYREAGVEREAGLGFGLRLFQFSKIRQRCGEKEMGQRVGPVDLDGAAKQCDRLLIGAKIHLRGAREMQP